jgi:hypothetical protein
MNGIIVIQTLRESIYGEPSNGQIARVTKFDNIKLNL